MTQKRTRKLGPIVIGAAAILFGMLTILSGGQALFGGPDARAAVGNAVPFVLWFNFGAGFAYVIAGTGVLMRRKWAVWLAMAIAFATVLTFAAFGLYAIQGGAHETRTVGALAVRSAFWIGVTVYGFTMLSHARPSRGL